MTNRLIALTLTLFALSIVGSAEAQNTQIKDLKVIEIDTNDSNIPGVQRCSDSTQSMSACRSFIKGFIQGALLTDTAIIKSIENSEPTIAERAFKTRLGSRVNRSPTALAGFCLPEGRTILDVAEETLDHVKDSERNSVELATKVYQSLKVDYPCQ
ncbi:MAG: transcriptional regulator of met regulon [Arenicella sp.]|jgi:transcriptional regulator of met regulon